MIKVTRDNYHNFLTMHGMHPETAEWVLRHFDNPEGKYDLESVRIWVEASKIVLELSNE